MKKKALWVDNQPSSLFGQDSDAFYYEERALLSAESGDIVIVDFEVDNDYIEQLRKLTAYQSIELICLKNKYDDLVESILNWEGIISFREYLKEIGCILRSYLPDRRIKLLSRHLGITARGVDFYEANKCQIDLIMLWEKLCLRKIETQFLSNSTKEEVVNFFESNKLVLCKPNCSIGGKGIFNVKKLDELKSMNLLQNEKSGYVLQRELKPDLEGSIQFLLDDGIFHIYICRTYNPQHSFGGFRYPCETELFLQLKKDGERIATHFMQKYKEDIDSFGIDFIISDGEIYYHDLNPRKTSVSYVLLFLKKICSSFEVLENHQVCCLYFKIARNFSYRELRAILEESDIPQLIEDGVGVMIINPDLIKTGLMQIVSFSRSHREKEYLERTIQHFAKKGVAVQCPDIAM